MTSVSTAEFMNELSEILGSSGLITDRDEMVGYVSDWRGAYSGDAVAVARPSGAEQVAAVVRSCAAAGAVLVPQGGNTGLCGGAVPAPVGEFSSTDSQVDCSGPRPQIVLSLSRMRKVLAVDPVENTISVEAGVTLQEVQEAAAEVGRLFPLSLGSEGSCTIGGNLSTNAGGTSVLRYGMMRALTLGLEVVLPDGRIWDGMRPLYKDNTGYDLRQLFIGAEGTLGVITAAILTLQPATPAKSTVWIALRDLAAVPAVLSLARTHVGDSLSAAELMSAEALRMVTSHVANACDPLADKAEWYLLLESAGSEGADVEAPLQAALEEASEGDLVVDAAFGVGSMQRKRLWALRESISEAQNYEGHSLKHDITVPLGKLVDFIDVTSERLERIVPGVRLVTFGHVGDGNLHYNLSKPIGDDDDEFLAREAELSAVIYDSVASFGGSVSAEHGLGVAKRDIAAAHMGDLELELMHTVKSAIDPFDVMNPGKVLK